MYVRISELLDGASGAYIAEASPRPLPPPNALDEIEKLPENPLGSAGMFMP